MRKGCYKIIPEQIEHILKYVEIGTPVEIALQAAGVAKSTFYKDQKNVETIIESGQEDLSDDESMLVEFMDNLKKAKARAAIRNITIINQAGKENWTASAWFLERRYAKYFSRKDHLQIDANLDVTNMDVELTEEEQKEYKKRRDDFFNNNLTIDDLDL